MMLRVRKASLWPLVNHFKCSDGFGHALGWAAGRSPDESLCIRVRSTSLGQTLKYRKQHQLEDLAVAGQG